MKTTSPSFDTLVRQFAQPPREYSPVPIWWWSGERLSLDRLRWQLEQLAGGGVYNVVLLNLAPSGPQVGSDADDPPFFSEEWWQIFRGVCAAARELGVRIWFYDQIGFSGANIQGSLVTAEPAFMGQSLGSVVAEGEGLLQLECPSEGEPLAMVLTDLERGTVVTNRLLARRVETGGAGKSRLRLVYAVRRGFDYFNPTACKKLIDTVHGEFERRAGDFLGDVIPGSFQDELPNMPTWGAGFAAAFVSHFGYDLIDSIGLLWDGEGELAQRVRADYHAMRALLAEDAFFKPLFDWHDRRGLVCGFDQQGPARSGDPDATVATYADYLKTHRWFEAPGSDHHGEAKIHSSLAHLYDRQRTWIESFHSSGWGGTLEETFDWLLPWLRAGANLYDPHAVYYSTRGGWWEWAPPSTCWRQPYWKHYPLFSGAVSRLCYALSQGDHVCAVGLLYPTTTVQANTTPDGILPAGKTASDAYLALVGRMIWYETAPGILDRDRRDFDVLDDDSVKRAEVRDGALIIGREHYQAVVLPACTALSPATADVLARFVEGGGRLIAAGALPEISLGENKEPVQHLRALFHTGRARFVPTPEDVPAALADLPRQVESPVPALHRRVDGHDVLFLPAAFPRATEIEMKGSWFNVGVDFDPLRYPRSITLRLTGFEGAPQLWNPLTGSRSRLDARPAGDATEVEVPFSAGPAALLVWDTESEALPSAAPPAGERALATLEHWQAAVKPTLDNRYGDLDRPAFSGAPPVQTWRFEHRVEGDETWRPVEATFGVYGWSFGPLPAGELPPPAKDVSTGLQASGWQPVRYSLSRGIAHDKAHATSLGPKGHVAYEFLDFGRARPGEAARFRTSVWFEHETRLHLALASAAAKRAWLNGELVGAGPQGYLWLAPVTLRAGQNLIELELTAEEPVQLRAAWALVNDPERFRRPELLTAADAPRQDSLVRFSAVLRIGFKPESGALHVGSALPARVLVNGEQIGQQGGFDPYGYVVRTVRYDTGAFRQGNNLVEVEVSDPGHPIALLVDVAVRGEMGETALLSSGPGWQVQRDGSLPAEAALRRRLAAIGWAGEFSANMDPAANDLWRRPHPLPGASWLEDRPPSGVVRPVVPDAFLPCERVEWFRWILPPGAERMILPVSGAARVWVDETELPIQNGVVDLPPGGARRVVRLRSLPDRGRSEGGVFSGPVTYAVGRGPVALGSWTENGLEAYSGGVRYTTSFSLDRAPAAGLVLDLGRVRGTAEVWVNGQPLGARIWSPYRFDLGSAAKTGENTVEVLVLNTLGPYLRAISPTHYVFDGQEVSGLFGPVKLIQSI